MATRPTHALHPFVPPLAKASGVQRGQLSALVGAVAPREEVSRGGVGDLSVYLRGEPESLTRCDALRTAPERQDGLRGVQNRGWSHATSGMLPFMGFRFEALPSSRATSQ